MANDESSHYGEMTTLLSRSQTFKLYKHSSALDALHLGRNFADTSLVWDLSSVAESGDTAVVLYDRTSSVSPSLLIQHFNSRFRSFGCPVLPALAFDSNIERCTVDDASSTSSLYERADYLSSAHLPSNTSSVCLDRWLCKSDSVDFGIQRRWPSDVHTKRTPKRRSIADEDEESHPDIPNSIRLTGRDWNQDISAVGPSCTVSAVEPLENSFSCPHCSKVFATRSTLRHHVICHDPVKAHKYHCTKCQRGFRYPKDLKRHSLVHRETHKTGGNLEDLACTVCHKSFSRRDNLARHQRLNSHFDTRAPEGDSSNQDQAGQISKLRGADTESRPPEEPAQAHDQNEDIPQSQSGSGKKPVVRAWPSQLTLPTRPTRKQSLGKRMQESSSEEGDGSDRNRREYKRQRPVRRRCYLVCPFHDCQTKFSEGISTLLRHLKDMHHINICGGCLKRGICQTSQACKKICTWRACRYRPEGSDLLFHERTIDCIFKRNEDVRETKYLLICQELGLVPKAITRDPEPRCLDCTTKDEEINRLQQSCAAKEEENARLRQQLSIRNEVSSFQFSETIDPEHQGDSSFSLNDVASSTDLPPWSGIQLITPWPELTEDPQHQTGSLPMLAMPGVGIAWETGSSQTNDRGSFTQPSFQVFSQMHTGQNGTLTELTELPDEDEMNTDTPKLSNMDESFDFDSYESSLAFENMGRHFDEDANGPTRPSRSRS